MPNMQKLTCKAQIISNIIISVFFTLIFSLPIRSQEPEKVIRSVFDEALTDRTAIDELKYICKNTIGRIPGSPAAAEAVEFTRQALIKAGSDSVWLQKVPVPHWERGTESCKVTSLLLGSEELKISTLGLSVGTSPEGFISKLIEVYDFEQLKQLGKKNIEGKVVFFNRPVDNKLINSFAGYGGAVNQRTQGAAEAVKFGAVAVIVRSATQALDNFPHTGVCHYEENGRKIPAVAISTTGAELLSRWLKTDSDLTIHLITTCKNFPDTWSWNVIGEIKGTQKPNEFFTVGGHLDAWDIAEGAHDDAGGCVQAIEMIRIYKKLGIRPKRTVRAVMFMNEEMSGTGGRIYALEAKKKGEIQYAALESDRGVLSPRGFGFDTDGPRLEKLIALSSYFKPYDIRDFDKGGGGSDISSLRSQGTLLIGSIPETQRYFYYHHSANDTFEQVNDREFQLGSAATASLIYLIDLFDL
jgi:carboxypeptidase Q